MVYLPLAAGQLNLGIAGFMAMGAYTAAYLTNEMGWGLGAAIPAGGAAAGVLALVVAIPILRTHGIYLALATFALGQVISAVFLNLEVVGAAAGYQVIAYAQPAVVIAVTIAVVLFVVLLSRTRFALYLTAIKNDTVVSDLLGLNVRALQVAVTFSIGAVIAGIGGGLYGHHFSFVEAQARHRRARLLGTNSCMCCSSSTLTVWGPPWSTRPSSPGKA